MKEPREYGGGRRLRVCGRVRNLQCLYVFSFVFCFFVVNQNSGQTESSIIESTFSSKGLKSLCYRVLT